MTTTNPEPDLRQAALDLLARAEELSKDFGPEVEAAVRRAAEHTLPDAEARQLYRRVLGIIRSEDASTLDGDERRRLAADIDAEVSSLVADAVSTPPTTTPVLTGPPTLVPMFGLTPHPVSPTPIYNGRSVPMTEGYVDVTTIPLWKDNARVRLQVEEFKERNSREPQPDELLKIMWGTGAGSGGRGGDTDPFKLVTLAQSIARRGVERPPILDADGELRDGNRRVAAALLVLADPEATQEEKDRARWVRVWMADRECTPDQLEAVVVALNFESDHKIDWPEYVKARLVNEEYEQALMSAPGGIARGAQEQQIRKDVGKRFAIGATDVLRYVRMIKWANDFEDYHLEEGKQPASVRYRSNDIFQWFYEIDAGKGQAKLTHQLEADDELRGMVYDLMYDVLDSGLQVRNLHKVVAQEDALALLRKAHDSHSTGDATEALDLVKDAVAEAMRRNPSRRGLAFDKFVDKVIDRFGAAATDDWMRLNLQLRTNLRRVLRPALAALEAVDVDEPDSVSTEA